MLCCAALVGLFAFGRGRRGRRGRPGRDAPAPQGAGRPEPVWGYDLWQIDRGDLKVGHDYGHALNGYRVLVLRKSGEGESLKVDGLMWHETRGELVEVELHDGELATSNPELIPGEASDTCLCGECDCGAKEARPPEPPTDRAQ